MRIDVVDPSAFTPPYDRALCAALAGAGASVRLVTSRFDYGPVAPAAGYAVAERFYRWLPRGRARTPAKLLQHVPDMLWLAASARRRADVVHFQWLAAQPLDVHLLARFRRPLVLTAHDVLPREPRPGQLAAQRRLYEQVDAVVVHTGHGRARLVDELAVDPAKVHLIAHGAFTGLRELEPRIPVELAQPAATGVPVVLQVGLMRPYKGIDVLLEAWRGIEGAELWIAGMPRMDMAPLRAAAPPGVRFLERFVDDAEIAALLQRADLVVLPYREIDQSGVLFAALGLGRPLLLTAVGGFVDIAAAGAAHLVEPGDADALRAALRTLLADAPARERLAASAERLAAAKHDWQTIADRHLDLYATLLRR